MPARAGARIVARVRGAVKRSTQYVVPVGWENIEPFEYFIPSRKRGKKTKLDG